MLFNQVIKKHILQGINDFQDKGLPNGFGPSSTYDLIYQGKRYPPKAVMAYANFHAEGRTIERYFKGGEGTPCFDALKRNGFEIVPKTELMEKNNVKKEFAAWLLKNAPGSYAYYLGNSIKSVIERLDEINSYFPGRDLYRVDENSFEELIAYIANKNRKAERLKNEAFYTYDRKHSKGIPIVILGKENYFNFLNEKFAEKTIDYWIFQGNPKIYDVKAALGDNAVKTWNVKVHKDKKSNLCTEIIEQQIDNLVYKLYDLTYEEVLVIEPDFNERMSREAFEALEVGQSN